MNNRIKINKIQSARGWLRELAGQDEFRLIKAVGGRQPIIKKPAGSPGPAGKFSLKIYKILVIGLRPSVPCSIRRKPFVLLKRPL